MTHRIAPEDHKAVLKALPAETRQRLLVKSDRKGLGRLAVHWGLILLIGILIWQGIAFWWLLLPIQGALIIFSFTILHECTHRTPFQTPWLNECVGWVSGLMVGLPFLWFRYFHLAHHKYTNDPEKDPELIGHRKPESLFQYAWYVSGIPIWISQVRLLFTNAFLGFDYSYLPKTQKRVIRAESLLIVLFYIVIGVYSCFISSVFVITWILPALMGQPLLRLYLLAEHGRCPAVANMLENTRTTYTISLVRFFAWNMPFHAEHHALPNVPFHHIPELNRLINADLKVTENGYIRFHRSYLAWIKRIGGTKNLH